MTPRRLAEVLQSYRFTGYDKPSLVRDLEHVLTYEGLLFERAAPADFLVDGNTALVAIAAGDRGNPEALAALGELDTISAIVIATQRSKLPELPTNKPVHVAHLVGGA